MAAFFCFVLFCFVFFFFIVFVLFCFFQILLQIGCDKKCEHRVVREWAEFVWRAEPLTSFKSVCSRRQVPEASWFVGFVRRYLPLNFYACMLFASIQVFGSPWCLFCGEILNRIAFLNSKLGCQSSLSQLSVLLACLQLTWLLSVRIRILELAVISFCCCYLQVRLSWSSPLP